MCTRPALIPESVNLCLQKSLSALSPPCPKPALQQKKCESDMSPVLTSEPQLPAYHVK